MNKDWRNSDGTVDYRDYISSKEWRRFREAYFRRHPNAVCAICKMGQHNHRIKFGTRLHLHHVDYRNVGCEEDNDVEPICKECHDKEHSGEAQIEGLMALVSEPQEPKFVISHREFKCTGDATAEQYWTAALAAVEKAKVKFIGHQSSEDDWRELKRLNYLEEFARFSLLGIG